MLLIFIAGLLAFAKGDLSPLCDLVESSFVQIVEDPKLDTLKISYSWALKKDFYSQYANVKNFWVRHGTENTYGGPINEMDAIFMQTENRSPLIVLTGVPRSKYYGVQICAIRSGWEDVDYYVDFINEARLDSIDLTSYARIPSTTVPTTTVPTTAISTDDPMVDDGFVDEVAQTSTVSTAATTTLGPSSLNPLCNVVQNSYTWFSEDVATKTITLRISWDKKLSSYAALDEPINHYHVRHGLQDSFATDQIDELVAQYTDTQGNDTVVVLSRIPAGSIYGVQICAMTTSDNYFNDWTSAWIGSWGPLTDDMIDSWTQSSGGNSDTNSDALGAQTTTDGSIYDNDPSTTSVGTTTLPDPDSDEALDKLAKFILACQQSSTALPTAQVTPTDNPWYYDYVVVALATIALISIAFAACGWILLCKRMSKLRHERLIDPIGFQPTEKIALP